MTNAGHSLCMTRHMGPQSPIIQKKNRALWATRAKPSAHTQADIVRLFAQPRSAPQGFPAKETFRSHGVCCKHLLIQHGFRQRAGETWVRGPLCWPFTGLQAGMLKQIPLCCQDLSPCPSFFPLFKEYSAPGMSFGVWKAQFKSQLWHVVAVGPWMPHLIPQILPA